MNRTGVVVDLFAGAGGWDCAARWLGLDPIGIENDPAACATRRAAGLVTIWADLHHFEAGPRTVLDGLIASPPCQIFSQAGGREGARLLPDLLGALHQSGWAWPGQRFPADARLLWTAVDWWDRHQPRWVACEQVRPVLPFWEAVAERMRQAGYRAWCGMVDAADHGVAQNRQRAILLAHRDRTVLPPEPTHTASPQPVLFGPPLRPWVSMAEALGWAGTLNTRQTTKLASGDVVEYTRPVDRPAPTVTVQGVSCGWVLNRREGVQNRARELDRPAPTVTTSAVDRNWCWDRPATTVTTDARIWPPGHKLNQTDIARLGRADAQHRYAARSGSHAIRVTPAEAAALQSFPPDWPWRGSKTAQARQIGNAVPPLLARALLAAVATPPNSPGAEP